MRSTFIALAVGVMLSPAALTQAFADRAPTADEQAKIEQALKDEGFTQWTRSNSTTTGSGKSTTRSEPTDRSSTCGSTKASKLSIGVRIDFKINGREANWSKPRAPGPGYR